MISIVTVTYNSYDFLNLLIESLEIYSHLPYELIVIDNSTIKQVINRNNVFYYPMSENIGHGSGLNQGTKFANFPFIMFLDVDTHFLCSNWEIPFIGMMKDFDVLGGKGVETKPIRPACMFMKKEFAKYDWRASEGYQGVRITPNGTDTAIAAYHQMLQEGVKIGFLKNEPNRYGTYTGEEFSINNIPVLYHHWSGTYLKERQKDFPDIDLFKEKEKLFSQIPWRLP